MMDLFSSGNVTGLFASLNIKKMLSDSGEDLGSSGNHSVVIVGYDKETKKFSFYDPQQTASGTFDWEDLEFMTGGK